MPKEAKGHVEAEAGKTPQKSDAPHEEESQLPEEAERHPEKAAEHDPVGEADAEVRKVDGVDDPIKFGAVILKVERPKSPLFSPSSACSTS